MDKNDICVDISAFSRMEGEIRKRCEVLERLSAAMNRNFSRVGAEFDGPNFRRAQQIVGDMQKRFSQALYKIDSLKSYFNRLEGCASEYLNCRCGE